MLYVYNGAGVSQCGALVLAYKQAETNGATVPNLRVLIFFSDIDMLSKPLRAGATAIGLNPGWLSRHRHAIERSFLD